MEVHKVKVEKLKEVPGNFQWANDDDDECDDECEDEMMTFLFSDDRTEERRSGEAAKRAG